jgi:hypothetical protein
VSGRNYNVKSSVLEDVESKSDLQEMVYFLNCKLCMPNRLIRSINEAYFLQTTETSNYPREFVAKGSGAESFPPEWPMG